ncbi:MAG: OmpA family protein [Spirochaetaceae bacterium]|jgi:outer membrane protein OmpA-like peptidoglycan-associated protein|nr:OmpA family protein [Spirochaetaceae bacterium]
MGIRARKRVFLNICLLYVTFFSISAVMGNSAEKDGVKFKVQTDKPYTIVERSNFARYDDGKYLGHVYREVRASINPSGKDGAGAALYRGNFIVMEETLRNMMQSARAVNAIIPVNFALSAEGRMRVEDDRGFPALRNFPVYGADSVTEGENWTADGERAIDPLNEGKTFLVPFTAVYEYKGIEDYKGIPVHRIEASYKSNADISALTPQASGAFSGSGGAVLNKVSGKHDVTILIAVENEIMLLSRDNLDETFSWNDGKNVRFKGFTLCFTQDIVPLDGRKIKKEVESTDGVELEPVDSGLRLSIRDLQFVSDSDQLLPSEAARIDIIAASLSGIEDRTFLVEGHTAATGRPDAEMRLSIERAKRIVDELSARGIPLGRFIYKGWGGTKPLGNNSSEEGRKLNRRVEITILD